MPTFGGKLDSTIVSPLHAALVKSNNFAIEILFKIQWENYDSIIDRCSFTRTNVANMLEKLMWA